MKHNDAASTGGNVLVTYCKDLGMKRLWRVLRSSVQRD
jgi:hypothetical protein